MGLQTIQLTEGQHYQLLNCEDHSWCWSGLGVFAGQKSETSYETEDDACNGAVLALLRLLGGTPNAARVSEEQPAVSAIVPDISNYVLGRDYEIRTLSNLYHWEGLDSGHGYEDYCSADGWPTAEQAQCDALYCLRCIDRCSHEEAMAWLLSYNHFSEPVLEGCAAENKNLPPLSQE